MTRFTNVLVNAVIGFSVAYLLGSRLQRRRTSVVGGLVFGLVWGVMASQQIDRLQAKATTDDGDTPRESKPTIVLP
ncbi:hypothetical protein [Halorarius litoreus]|uniref:hypothetical protein n=1 Tax=Halorarius litoreus TaxID=2962676 RepID=UPI0020CB7003|nr:hypothetical protein [Halorarius litoreus]